MDKKGIFRRYKIWNIFFCALMTVSFMIHPSYANEIEEDEKEQRQVYIENGYISKVDDEIITDKTNDGVYSI